MLTAVRSWFSSIPQLLNPAVAAPQPLPTPTSACQPRYFAAAATLACLVAGCDMLEGEELQHYLDRKLEEFESRSDRSNTQTHNRTPPVFLNPRVANIPSPTQAMPSVRQNNVDAGVATITCSPPSEWRGQWFASKNLWNKTESQYSTVFRVNSNKRLGFLRPTIRDALHLQPNEVILGVTISVFTEDLAHYSTTQGRIIIQIPTEQESTNLLLNCGVMAVKDRTTGDITRYLPLDSLREIIATTLPRLVWTDSHSITVDNL